MRSGKERYVSTLNAVTIVGSHSHMASTKFWVHQTPLKPLPHCLCNAVLLCLLLGPSVRTSHVNAP